MKVSPDLFDSDTGFFLVHQNCFRKVYQLQSDLESEEAKGDEILKLHNSLQAIHSAVDETYALLTKDRESAHKAVEEASAFVHETALIDVKYAEIFDKLSAEVEELKAAREIGALQEANDKLQKEVEDLTSRLESEKRAKISLEEAKGHEILKLQNSLQAMEAKIDETSALLTKERESSQKNIDKLSAEVEELKKLLESEKNRANESETKCREVLKTSEIKHQNSKETVNRANQLMDSRRPSLDLKLQKSDKEKLQKSDKEKLQEYQDLLIRCIAQNLGFSKGRPVAACIIYKCLRNWRSFESYETTIFARIIQTIHQAIKTQDNNNEVLAYWLSNASTLKLLLPRGMLKTYVALLFNVQLTAFVENTYGVIRDNFKKEISPLINVSINAPKNKATSLIKRTTVSQDIHIDPWQEIVDKFDSFLKMFKSNNVPPFLVREIFTQIFYLVNVELFNSLLLRRECCSFSNGEYVKAGLSELEHWCYKATEEYVGSAWDELKHIRQAIGFLVINQKPKKTPDEIIHDLCPVLTTQQLYRITTMFWDDKYGTHSVSSDVISNLRVLMTENSKNSVTSSFLLDDDPRKMRFSVDDLLKSMGQIDIEDVEPP